MFHVSNDLYAELKKSSTYSHTWLGLSPQIGRPLSRIVGAIYLFLFLSKYLTFIEYFLCSKILDGAHIQYGESNFGDHLEFNGHFEFIFWQQIFLLFFRFCFSRKYKIFCILKFLTNARAQSY
jgi:hypothetical protein